MNLNNFFKKYPEASFLLEKDTYPTFTPCKKGEIEVLKAIAYHLYIEMKLHQKGVVNLEDISKAIFYKWRGIQDIDTSVQYLAGTESKYHPMYGKSIVLPVIKCSIRYVWGARSYEEYLTILHKKLEKQKQLLVA